MSWSDLSPAVRGFIVIGAALLALLVMVRGCTGGDEDTPAPPRGPVQ